MSTSSESPPANYQVGITLLGKTVEFASLPHRISLHTFLFAEELNFQSSP